MSKIPYAQPQPTQQAQQRTRRHDRAAGTLRRKRSNVVPISLSIAVFWDIRTPEEHAEGAKRYMKNIPVAFMTEKGPKLNGKFGAYFAQEFPNKMSRVILVSTPHVLSFISLTSQGCDLASLSGSPLF